MLGARSFEIGSFQKHLGASTSPCVASHLVLQIGFVKEQEHIISMAFVK